MKNRIMVFIPMYNCEKQISRVIKKFSDIEKNLFEEIVVVDNISPDNSVKNAISALEKLTGFKTTLLKNHKNYNLGGSIKVAFNYAIKKDYDYMITLHGDDQGDIRDIISYIKSGSYSEHDIVVGARFHKDSKLQGYSLIRTLGNYGVNLICSIITAKKIDDMVAGLNIFNVSFLKENFYMGFPNNLTFDAHVLLYALSNKKSVEYIPITWREEDQVSNAKVFRQGLTLLKLFFKYLFQRKSMFRVADDNISQMQYTSEIIYKND